jgi:hypothetical protein
MIPTFPMHKAQNGLFWDYKFIAPNQPDTMGSLTFILTM